MTSRRGLDILQAILHPYSFFFLHFRAIVFVMYTSFRDFIEKKFG